MSLPVNFARKEEEEGGFRDWLNVACNTRLNRKSSISQGARISLQIDHRGVGGWVCRCEFARPFC